MMEEDVTVVHCIPKANKMTFHAANKESKKSFIKCVLEILCITKGAINNAAKMNLKNVNQKGEISLKAILAKIPVDQPKNAISTINNNQVRYFLRIEIYEINYCPTTTLLAATTLLSPSFSYTNPLSNSWTIFHFNFSSSTG